MLAITGPSPTCFAATASRQILYSRMFHQRGFHLQISGREQMVQPRKSHIDRRYSDQTRRPGKYLIIIRRLHTSVPVYGNPIIEPPDHSSGRE